MKPMVVVSIEQDYNRNWWYATGYDPEAPDCQRNWWRAGGKTREAAEAELLECLERNRATYQETA